MGPTELESSNNEDCHRVGAEQVILVNLLDAQQLNPKQFLDVAKCKKRIPWIIRRFKIQLCRLCATEFFTVPRWGRKSSTRHFSGGFST
jgi:hypothetical protein